MGSADEEEFAREKEAKRKATGKGKEKSCQTEPIIPFPGRMAKEQEKEELTELVKIFKKVEVNMPLLVARRSMPRCAKFLNELCTRKVKYTDDAKFQVGESVSAVLQRDMPIKCGDPDMFYIPCVIGTMKMEKAMLDLGASINIMPLYMYQDLEIGPLKPTRVVIQLADRSNVYPEGILEDVLVKVEELIFPADFYILDMGKSKARDPPIQRCMVKSVDMIEKVVEEVLPRTAFKEPYDTIIQNGITEEDLQEEHLQEAVKILDAWSEGVNHTEALKIPTLKEEDRLVPSIQRAPKLELKSLPKHLKYIFLGEDDTLPVIINSELTLEDENKVKMTLGKYKEAIGWTLADIKGISPTLRIFMLARE
ncbi:uncharacterized protein LOC131025901 [Salvia miltiorrhiza]|uniref:uncharacterized protein LOC131025901 n=1 Tax=Salvia miltiorrhiza TaxID=226208 RepID=UPI0025AD5B77|nr:uncharacterized protein LOC131025901 [Salvia miltiorrhiza]